MNRTSEKSAFPFWNLVHSAISLQFSPPAAKKAKTKRFYTLLLGRKKRQSSFSPKQNLLARAKQFMFEVGAKIDVWQFYVQSRSQNRSVTTLNLYMGGGRGTHRFPPSTDVSTPVSTDVSTPVSTDVSTDVRVYAHLFDFFGNFKNSWKIYEPNKWKKCVSFLEFGAFRDFVAI